MEFHPLWVLLDAVLTPPWFLRSWACALGDRRQPALETLVHPLSATCTCHPSQDIFAFHLPLARSRTGRLLGLWLGKAEIC